MNFLSKLFKRKSEYDEDYEEIDFESENFEKSVKRQRLDLKDPLIREQYVRECLEEMKDSSDEIDRLNREYEVVTGYLTDMEEVEEIPSKEKKNIEDIAKHIKQLRTEHDAYVLKESTMTDREFMRLKAMEEEIESGIKKLEEEENYRKKVKQDLSRIDKEKHAYNYRRRELKASLENSRGIAFISIGAAFVLIMLLLTLKLLLKIDVSIGYYITVFLAALSLTIIYFRYVNFERELKKVESTINELILLENKVKIRYVNNKSLLDYLYTKYDVPDAWTLKDMYARYLEEKEDRLKFEKNEVLYQDELARLVRELRKFRIKDPEIWVHQVEALIDSREMVEIRHGLIARRQKLRKQIEYNQDIAMEAGEDIKEVINKYPESAESIKSLLEEYNN